MSSHQPNPISSHMKIKQVIGVMSSKGGVGKSFITGLLATELSRAGFQVGILDADLTAPSIPMLFGVQGPIERGNYSFLSLQTGSGIKIISPNLLVEDGTQPFIWKNALAMDEGGGAFYGPKIDLKIKDAIGREWQLSTIQFVFNLPDRFDLTYIAEDGQSHRPYMFHRALLGSLERFFGVLIEFYAGAFPVWLSPVQAVLIPIADRHLDYAKEVADKLRNNGLRVKVDDCSERMNAKIRDAQNQKIPYILVIGDKEVEDRQVALRLRGGENPGPMPFAAFIAQTKDEILRKI